MRSSGCAICEGAPLDTQSYAALLGYYLGDGCISAAPRYFFLRVTCDLAYPAIINVVSESIRTVRPGGNVFRVPGEGCLNVQSNWKHWLCLFPQHGPGRKHDRPIVLEDWQSRNVEANPGPFLRGLFHSDGCRARNCGRLEALRLSTLAVLEPVGRHPRAVLLGAGLGRSPVAPVQRDDDQRLHSRRGSPPR